MANGSAAKPSPAYPANAVVGAIGRVMTVRIERLAILFSAWRQRGVARRQLHSLNDHMLRDMGMARHEFERTGRSGRLDM
jgi:uncharacterized protein YjiS (DUF1127 family)